MTKKRVEFTRTITLPVKTKHPLPGGGFKTVCDGMAEVEVVLALDVDRMAQILGAKAFYNKSKATRFLDGNVVAKATMRRIDR